MYQVLQNACMELKKQDLFVFKFKGFTLRTNIL